MINDAVKLKPADKADKDLLAKLEQEACVTFAALHNSTTPAQRHKAMETLSRHAQDLRTLVKVDL